VKWYPRPGRSYGRTSSRVLNAFCAEQHLMVGCRAIDILAVTDMGPDMGYTYCIWCDGFSSGLGSVFEFGDE
jgi:hypothetical protein